jgi:hypothetical protein
MVDPLLLEPTVAFRAKVIDLREHALQQFLRSPAGNAGALQVFDFPSLPVNLTAHMFNFISEIRKVRCNGSLTLL